MKRLRHTAVAGALAGQVTSATSQVLGGLQLALLLSLTSLTGVTDAYFYLFAWGQAPLNVLIFGYWYPVLLGRSDSPPAAEVRLVIASVALATATLTGVGYSIAVIGNFARPSWVPIAFMLALSNVLAVGTAAGAAAGGASGSATAMSGIALPANIGAVAALLGQRIGLWEGEPVTIMVVGLMIGNSGGLWFYWVAARARGWISPANPQFERNFSNYSKPRTSGGAWILANSCMGFAGQLSLQTAAGALGTGIVSLYALLGKGAVLIIGVGVNGALPAVVRRGTPQGQAKALVAAVNKWALPILVGVVIIGGVASFPIGKVSVWLGALWGVWIFLGAVSALVSRLLHQQGRTRRFKTYALVAGTSYVAATAAIVTFRSFPILLLGGVLGVGLPALAMAKDASIRLRAPKLALGIALLASTGAILS